MPPLTKVLLPDDVPTPNLMTMFSSIRALAPIASAE
jgi:hypothetical protein